jgi:hypothetical protein
MPPTTDTIANVWSLNLIRFFDFYLALAFLLSTFMRFQQYEAIVRLVRALPERWPRLLRLLRQHHAIFLTWPTILPAALALLLSLTHMLAYHLIWPHAKVTVSSLAQWPGELVVVACLGLAMLGVDVYGILKVGKIDRPQLEVYFDQAEYWLRSWVAPVVHVFTFGYVNPRKMVSVEVHKALLQTSKLLNSTLWWISLQVGLRIAFGLSLWLSFALGGPERPL